eukprot:NODE_113_length_2492_cov_63.191158_g101_i0.p1 GENE.NODE_113_length_2492_cov_63.191158_g101_i0~~NODE_113_length_2492_cov_63.191158_g101_i0.p1  ORF type:complete len:444 (-),score=122.93 NODE_113_length_2492_cov_63.191158_g101_i0:136-1467(-)
MAGAKKRGCASAPLRGERYRLTQDNVEFSMYLRSVGYNVISMPERMSACYGINFLNVGNSRLITCDPETADYIARSPHFGGEIHNIEFQELKKLHGALNCCTQVWRSPTEKQYHKPDESHISIQVAEVRKSPTESLPEVRQTTNWVLLMAPTYFAQNPETLQDNAFMQTKAAMTMTSLEIVESACNSFANLYTLLIQNGVHVKLFHHESYHDTPDAVFPNNWFSTHADIDTFVLYPMKFPSRQRERRRSVINFLKSQYSNLIDLTYFETVDDPDSTKALEGTGSLVLDRVNKVAYAAESGRTDRQVVDVWCKHMGYRAVVFKTVGDIYHTNVMMHVGQTSAVVCVESIVPEDRHRVLEELRRGGRMVIRATKEQCLALLCNCIEVMNDRGESILVMSSQAYHSMTQNQRYQLSQSVDHILHAEYSIIEKVAGGGVRCSIAELF